MHFPPLNDRRLGYCFFIKCLGHKLKIDNNSTNKNTYKFISPPKKNRNIKNHKIPDT